MPHETALITTIAAGLGLALILGFVAVRLRLPPWSATCVAGIVIGPATPGFVADVELAGQLAEIGVMLLMFGVGLHFSFDDLLSVRRIALPGAIVQIAVATALGAGVATLWGWSSRRRHRVRARALGREHGRAAARARGPRRARIGQRPHRGRLAGGRGPGDGAGAGAAAAARRPRSAATPARTAAADGGLLHAVARHARPRSAAFVALMLVVGRRLFPWLLWQVARTGSRELFTLCVDRGRGRHRLRRRPRCSASPSRWAPSSPAW